MLKSTFIIFLFLSAALLAIVGSPLMAQNQTLADSLFQVGNQFMNDGDWKKAAATFEQAVNADSNSAAALSQLGQAHYMANNFKKAAAAWEKADDKNFRRPATRYNLATAYARMGKRERAFTWLSQALEVGFKDVEYLKKDPAFEKLRSDERFARVIELADWTVHPCEHEPIFRKLDFLIGEWELIATESPRIGVSSAVKTADSLTAASVVVANVTVKKVLSGCALREEIVQLGGWTAERSYYYNSMTGEWKMLLLTSTGVGQDGIRERTMTSSAGDSVSVRFLGTVVGNDGRKMLDSFTLTPVNQNSVVLVVQQSLDGGANWSTVFNGEYRRIQTEVTGQ